MGGLSLKIAAMTKDGRLWLHINGKPYYYELDAVWLPKVERLVAAGNHGTALGLVKAVSTYYERLEV